MKKGKNNTATFSIMFVVLCVMVGLVVAQPPQPITVSANQTFTDFLVVVNRSDVSFLEWFPSATTRSTAVAYFTNYTTTHATGNHSYSWGYDNGTGDLTWPENNTVGYLARSANFSGTNLTATVPYGEIWNHTSTGYGFTAATAGVYYNLTGLIPGTSNGFTYTQAPTNMGGDYLTATLPGTYITNLHISGEGSTAGGVYGISVAKNFDESISRQCYTRKDGTSTVDEIALSCHLSLNVGDTVNVKVVELDTPTKEFMIYTVNLNLHRIGEI